MTYTLEQIFLYSEADLNQYLVGDNCQSLNQKRYAVVNHLGDDLRQDRYTQNKDFKLALLNSSSLDQLKFILDNRYIISLLNNKITTLNLAGSNLDLQGAQFLSDALKTNKSLITLNLGDNNLRPQGARFLSEALKINTSLNSLYLWLNDLGPEGAQFLSEALKINTSLTNLDLVYNNLGSQGARFLFEALKVNRSLISLNLGYNCFNSIELNQIRDKLTRNKYYKEVTLPQLKTERQNLCLSLIHFKVSYIINELVDFHRNVDYFE